MVLPSQPPRVRRRLAVLVTVGGTFVLAGGGGLAALESNVVPTFGQGVWWALSLMTTVGFVGENPETTAGRVLSAVLMVAGFAMMTLTTATIASMLVREDEEPARQAETAFETSSTSMLASIDARLRAIEARLDSGRAVDDGAARSPRAPTEGPGAQPQGP